MRKLAAVFGLMSLASTASAGPAVVAHSACPQYAVDIEASATGDVDRVVSVVDGYEGDFGPDGQRAGNGWKNAGLPWIARAKPALIARAR